MACASKKQSPSSIVDDINSLNLFGKCQAGDLIFSDDERKEKEKKFIQEQEKRMRQYELEQKKKKKNERAYEEFIKNSEEKGFRKRNGITHYVPPLMNRGRGSILNSTVSNGIREITPRGRGRLSPEEKERLSLFERQTRVTKNLELYSDSSLHNNVAQKSYWNGRGLNIDEEQEIDLFAADYTESSSASDIFEDAEYSPFTGSPQSFNSAPSRLSGSPLSADSPAFEPSQLFEPRLAKSSSPDLVPPLPQPSREDIKFPSRPRKQRGSRLAAKFTNKIEEDADTIEGSAHEDIKKSHILEETDGVGRIEEERDPLAILGSSRAPLARKVKMNGNSGTLFNSLHPSQRVLSNNLLRPEDLYSASACGSKGFSLDSRSDFPEL